MENIFNTNNLFAQPSGPTAKEAVIFARVSSREQARGQSTTAQIMNCQQYCDSMGIKVIKIFNITESSTRGERKRFKEVLEFVKARKAKTLIIADCVDRIQRSFKETVELKDLAEKSVLEIHFLRDCLTITDHSTSSEQLRWNMSVLAAQAYVDSLRDNVNRSMQTNWSNGLWQSFAPLGYLNDEDEKQNAIITLDPVRAPLVKKMFEEYATGQYSVKSIAKWAHDNGLTLRKTPTKPERDIPTSTIHTMLQNPFYYGYMIVKGIRIKHIYPPLIDEILFERVQDILHGRCKLPAKSVYREKQFMFRGIVKCAHCGHTMTPEKHRKANGKEYSYLRCSHIAEGCSQKPIREDELLSQLEQELTVNCKLSDKALTYIRNLVQNDLEKENQFKLGTEKYVLKRITELKARKQRLTTAWADGDIDKESYEEAKKSTEQEIQEQEKIYNMYLETGTNILETMDNIEKIFENPLFFLKSSQIEVRSAFLRLIFANCYVDNKKARFSLKKSLSLFVKNRDFELWQPHSDLNRDSRLERAVS